MGTVYPGDATTFNITISPNDYAGTVTLSGAGDCGTNNITCSFPDGNTADLSAGTVYKTLQASTTGSTGINTYTITVTGTDTVPDPDLIDSASATLEVKPNPNAVCGEVNPPWRDIPGTVQNFENSYSAAHRSDGVYLFSAYNSSFPANIHGLEEAKCIFYAGGVCLWSSSWGASGADAGVASYKAYAESPGVITGNINKFFKDYNTGNTWKYEPVGWEDPPGNWNGPGWYNKGIVLPEKPWNTPHSLTDKDGRPWEFQIVGNKAQYKCGPLPNQATCNGTWQSMPGGGNTPSQPVGIQLGSVYSDKIGFVMRGTDNQTYYRTCDFHGDDCNFSNNWTNIGGSPYYSPRTFFGADWDFNIKDISKTYWAKFLHSIPINTWSDWENRGSADEPWGTPYRFNDKLGRTWQLQRKADTTIEYACGANVCITPAFDSSKSSVSPTTVNINDNVTIRCDVGVMGMDGIVPSFTGGTYISYDGYDVTTAKFTFKATQAGTHTVNCHTWPTGQNFCDSINTAGALTVVAPNQSPAVPSVTVTEPDYCSSGPAAYVNWTYSDPEGNPQSAYQVQIDDLGSAWNLPYTLDSSKVTSSGTSYFASGLAFDITYKARVRVWDSNDNVSAWKDSGSWKTPKHAYPLVDFTYSPSTDIPAKQPVQFTDTTTFYDGGGARAWNWLFKAPSSSPSSTLQNPTYTYDNPGTYDVTETATDKDNYSCSRTKQLNIAQPVPVWKEVSPR